MSKDTTHQQRSQPTERQQQNERAAWHIASRLREQGIHAIPFYSGEGLGMWIPMEATDRLLEQSAPEQPEWLSQALNEGDGTYKP